MSNKLLSFKDIPKNLNELLNNIYIDNSELDKFSESFDNAMLELGFFEEGSWCFSCRRITDLASETGYIGIIKVLTGLSTNEVRYQIKKESELSNVLKMYEYAKMYGYTVTKDKK